MAIGGSLSIASTDATSSAGQTRQAQFKQRKQDFDDLKSALDSGDLKAAQAAYAKVQADAPKDKKAPQGGNGQQDPLSSIGAALSSGDIAGAQKAFASIQQQMQAHHAHHGGGQQGNDNDGDDQAKAMVASTTGTGVNVDTTA